MSRIWNKYNTYYHTNIPIYKVFTENDHFCALLLSPSASEWLSVWWVVTRARAPDSMALHHCPQHGQTQVRRHTPARLHEWMGSLVQCHYWHDKHSFVLLEFSFSFKVTILTYPSIHPFIRNQWNIYLKESSNKTYTIKH